MAGIRDGLHAGSLPPGADRISCFRDNALGTRSTKTVGGIDTEAGSGEPVQKPTAMLPQVVFALAILGFFGFAVWEGTRLSFLGGIFITGVGVTGILATLLLLVPLVRGNAGSAVNYDSEAGRTGADHVGPLAYVGWLAGFVGATALVGFFAALILFFLVFLRLVASASWLTTLALTAAIAIILGVLASTLNLVFPGGYLQAIYDLPWPFR